MFYPDSDRYVSFESARRVSDEIKDVNPSIRIVGVFVNPTSDMVGDAMNAEGKAMKKSYEERKVGEATSEANKLAKESGLSADEAEVEISKSEEAAEEEIANSQKKAITFFTIVGLSFIALLWISSM